MKKVTSIGQRLKETGQYSAKFVLPLIFVLSGSNKAISSNVDRLSEDYQKEISNIIKSPDLSNITDISEYFDKEGVAKEYLENNLFINGKPITSPEFNHQINKINKDIYEINYLHTFEGLPGFSQDRNIQININVKFTYKDNNIFIEFDNVNIGGHTLDKNGEIPYGNIIYDYNISEGTNKSIQLNSKVNPHKTQERIKNVIRAHQFNLVSKLESINNFENTQLLKLNDMSLGNEVIKEGEFFYREVFITENGQYRPLTKVYFDKHGKLDLRKTNEQKEKIQILGLDINLEITESGGAIQLKISPESIDKLQNKISQHRTSLMEIIDKAKVGPNTEFKGFNKTLSGRVWSNKEERLFDTELLSLELIDDTYIFQRGDKNQAIYFGIEPSSGGEDKIYLKNTNNQKVDQFFVTIKNNFYKVILNDNQLEIFKLNKEGENVENNLPKFSGETQMVSILSAKNINTYYDKDQKILEYIYDDGIFATSISCEKTEQGEYNLNKNSTNIQLEDLYNTQEFKNIISSIKKTQDKIGVLDVDIMNIFSALLIKNGVKLDNQDLIKVTDKNGNIYYCTIRSKRNSFEIKKDAKLYKQVEVALNRIKSRLEIIEKLNNTKIQWINNGQKQDFTKFVGGGWGIGQRFIDQKNIIDFVGKNTDEINLTILRGEGQSTQIAHDISSKAYKAFFKGRKKVWLSGQQYELKIDKDIFTVILDPVEKKLR